MFDAQDSAETIINYLNKLKKIIYHETKLNLGTIRVVDKTKIDDILCCIEGALPQEYKDYLKKFGSTKLNSNVYFANLHSVIKNKFLFSTTNYAVKVQKAEQLITILCSTLPVDFNKVFQNSQ